MIIKFEDIKIDPLFASTTPSQQKMDMCRDYFNEHGTVDKKITVDKNLVLTDGYIRYLVLQEAKWDGDIEVKMLQKSKESRRYVYARHQNNDKLYVWRVPKNTELDDSIIGKTILVNANNTTTFVKVDKVEITAYPPVRGRIRNICSTTIDGKVVPVYADAQI